MHPFSELAVKFNLNKGNVIKLNSKHKYVELDRLNMVLNLEEALRIPNYISNFLEKKRPFPIPNFWELSFIPIPIPNILD